MKPLISNEINSSLCYQIGHELYNANLYLCMASFLKNKGLNNLATAFEHQNEEEITHSKLIVDFLTDMNSKVEIPEIDQATFETDDIRLLAKAYLEKEMGTTKSLAEIKDMAITEGDCITEEFMRQMICLQRSEYAEANDFYDKSELTGGDWFKAMVWDLGIE